MSTWFIFAFAAQLLWVVGALLDKTLLEKYAADGEEVDSASALVFVSAVFSSFIALGILLFAFKHISVSEATVYGLIAGVLNGLWVYLYLNALDITESSKAIPFFQTIPIFGMVFAAFFLGEVLGTDEILAIFIILIGALVLNFNLKTKNFDLAPSLLMLIASGTVAMQETIFKVTDGISNYWNAIFWMTLGMPVFVLLLWVLHANLFTEAKSLFSKKFIPMWSVSSINEIVDNGATLLFVFAITLGPVAVVQSVNAFQPVILLIAATIIAKLTKNYIQEDLAQNSLIQKILGVSVITIGSLLLYTNLL